MIVLEAIMDTFSTFSYVKNDLSLMPSRPQRSNKGTFGRVLCICGSHGMAGAAYLSAKAALRTGAGLVEILTPECNRTVLQTLLPEAIVTTYDPECISEEIIDSALSRASAVVCGCGIGISATSRRLLARVLRGCEKPMVLDADALNLISRNPSLLKYARGKIITPHPAEHSRLTGKDVSEITEDISTECYAFAKKHSLTCVLKDHNTAVSDGSERVYINKSGNSGMATAGSGDVLAGIIGGILSQNRDSALTNLQVASLGVYIHGLAGDAAALSVGEYSLIASDIIEALPRVLTTIK